MLKINLWEMFNILVTISHQRILTKLKFDERLRRYRAQIMNEADLM